jgi:uncharacterized repeat protein (TIGR01451 family)
MEYRARMIITSFATAVAVIASLVMQGGQAYAVDKFMVTKTADNPTITAGQVASFTIVATAIAVGLNNTVENFTLSDTLPAGTWTVGGPDAAACGISGGVLTCSFGGVPEGQTRTVTVSRVTASADCNTTITNTARVTSDDVIYEFDNDLLDNTSTATITVNCAPPPPPSARITPTGTTCQQFRDGTAANLDAILYSTRSSGDIGNVAPGIGFYFVRWSGGTIHIVQSDDGITPAFGVQSVQVYLASTCDRTRAVSVSTSGTTTTVSGLGAGDWILRLAFDPNTVVGTASPAPATVTYTYTTTEVGGSTDSIALAPK